MIRFTVESDPVPAPRPKVGNGRAYYPKKTGYKPFLAKVRSAAMAATGKPLSGPLFVSVIFEAKCREGDERVRAPYPGGWRDTAPDLDNFLKGLLDGCEGVCFKNDGQVAKVYAEKRWAPQGRPGCIYVAIVPLTGHDRLPHPGTGAVVG